MKGGWGRIAPASPVVVGLSGVFAVLFVLGQTHLLLDWASLDEFAPLTGILESSNVAITGFLVIVGHESTRRLLDSYAGGLRWSFVVLAQYLVALLVLLVLVVAAVYLLSLGDSTDPFSPEVTESSVRGVLGLRWNEWVATRPLSIRADLTSLWYFSIEAQLVLATFPLFLVFRRSPAALGGVALTVALVALIYRVDVFELDGWFDVTLRTAARADAFALGVASACLVRLRPLSGQVSAGLCGGSTLVLAGSVLASPFLSITQVFLVQVPVVALVTALFLAGSDQGPDPRTLVMEGLAARWLVALGRQWRPLVAWTLPVFVAVARHTEDASGSMRTFVGVVSLGLVVTVWAIIWEQLRDVGARLRVPLFRRLRRESL